MQRVLVHNDLVLDINVRVGQIDQQNSVVVTETGAEQQRLATIHRKFQVRKKTGIVVKKAIGAAGGYPDVAMTVEHREGVAIFERAASPGGKLGRGDVKGRLGNQIYFGCRRDAIS